ncbi:MAG: glycosyltransferase family 2 protein [Planctomycetota bacterium]
MTASVLVLTYNEEVNLPRCIASVSFSNDVVIYDSFSTDRTVETARGHGARVFQRVFDSYGAQREAARTQVEWRNPWLLVVDADEEVDDELRDEILVVTARPTTHAAYRVRRKDHFMGRWIKHSTLYPSWFVRLLRHQRVAYGSRTVHEYPDVDGTIGELQGHLVHHSFSKGVEAWLHKHNRYSTMEADETVCAQGSWSVDWGGLLPGVDPVRRRRALKALSMHMPFRPSLRFLYMYVLRGGVLDGWEGFTYCRLLSMYEHLIVLKVKEKRRRLAGLPV